MIATQHPPSLSRPSVQQIGHAAERLLADSAPRTRFVDRVAMRIGLALLIWGARSTRTAAPRKPRNRIDANLAREVRRDIERNEAHQMVLRGTLGGSLGR